MFKRANMIRRLRSKRIKVAVDLTPMLPGGVNGGVKPAILEFIRALQQFSEPHFRFYFITAASTHHEVEAIATEHDAVICIEWPDSGVNLTPNGFQKNSIDVLYAPFGMIRFPDCGIPAVTMIVDLLHRDYPFSITEEERQTREEYFAGMVQHASRFQVISEFTGSRLIHHYGVPAGKIFRTYLAIHDRIKVRDIPSQCRRNPYFFYPANFWLHKNHEILLIAFQIYQHQAGSAAWDLILTGSDDKRRCTLQELAMALGISDHVVFKGHVSDEELAQLYSGADVLVFPSLHEGFGIPPLEAMNLGIPVLASHEGSLHEIVGEAALLVDPKKPFELADAMTKLASSEQLRAELRCRGVQRAKDFSFPAEVTSLAQMLVKLAPTWDRRLRRRVSQLWSNGRRRARIKIVNACRFCRNCLGKALRRGNISPER